MSTKDGKSGQAAPTVQGGLARSPCPIASTLDIVGDKWTLIVLRDLMTGKERFNQFAGSPERIPTNLLAERLGRLEAAGLITREAYQQRPKRYGYHLTEAGRAFKPILVAMCHWGNDHIEGTWRPPASFYE